MATIYVAFLLDFFQPSTQSHAVIDEISRECYQPVVELFNSNLRPKFTVSLANSLATFLQECGHDRIIDELREAIDGGKVELIHTGAYHPIFPLIPEPEVRRQIDLDIHFKRKHFGLTKRSGIFSPEMCYHDRLMPLYTDMGFRWTIMDDRLMEMNGIETRGEEIAFVNNCAVFLRSSFWSDKITPPDENGRFLTGRQFVDHLVSEARARNRDSYKIVALAGETFGHHVKYYQETFLTDMLFALDGHDSVRLCTVSELLGIPALSQVAKAKSVDGGFDYFPPSSWATQPDNYRRGDFYPHWQSRGNPIHNALWELTDLILSASHGIDFANPSNSGLRYLLDRAFYSTQYFWASVWFWKADHAPQVYEGIDLQMRALYKCARLTRNEDLLSHGERIYARLLWEIHKAGGKP